MDGNLGDGLILSQKDLNIWRRRVRVYMVSSGAIVSIYLAKVNAAIGVTKDARMLSWENWMSL